MAVRDISRIPAVDKSSGAPNVIVETPKGGRTKFKYDEKLNLFKFDKALPFGHSFPFQFGFLTSTLGGDGDPLDLLVLSDEPAFVGCLVLGKLLGALQAEQGPNGTKVRNDRLIAVPVDAKTYKPVHPAKKLDTSLVSDITKLFVSYNQMQGKEFKPLGTAGGKREMEIVQQGIKRAREKTKA